MKMPHDATNISQLDLSDSDREDANHGKQLTICWMVHRVHDHALCQTQYYCILLFYFMMFAMFRHVCAGIQLYGFQNACQ